VTLILLVSNVGTSQKSSLQQFFHLDLLIQEQALKQVTNVHMGAIT
jgi:hypothetical protein